MLGTREGFDAPIESADDDLLGRWGFAHEIFTLATQCPDEWSVRVGVYGDWGTGKTSVLNFVEKMARQQGHTVMWFNPWGVKRPDHLWRGFIQEIAKTIEPRALGPDVTGVKRAELAKRATEVLLGIGKLFSETEKFADAGSSLLSNWLKSGPEDLKKISDYFRGHRLIVLIDDLDRTDPALVPEILFALKEIFDLPGFSFIMGFDRQRVGAALASHHPGWGRGIEFLDKVVDFPRWLPVPDAAALRKLALRDLRKYASFVDVDAYVQVEEHAPVNPRELRRFARGLTGFQKEAKRYGKGEIDWPLFFLLSFFRARWPMAFESVFHLPAMEKLAIAGYPAFDDSKAPTDAARAAIEAHLRSCALLEASEIPKARAILEDIFRKTRGLSSQRKVVEMAFLLEHPKPVTRKELEQLIDEWKQAQGSSTLAAWIQRQAKAIQQPESSVHAALFEEVLTLRDEMLHSAASAIRTEKTLEYCAWAQDLLKMLWLLSIDLSGSGQASYKLELEQFQSLLRQAIYWSHFRNHEVYRKLRAEELQLLSQVVQTAAIDVREVLEVVAGIDPYMAQSSDHVKNMREALLSFLAPQAATWLLRAFRQQHAIDAIVYSQKDLALKRVLLDPQGSFWTASFRSSVSDLASQAIEDPVIQENFYSFAMTLKGDLERGQAAALGSDGDALRVIWTGASARSVNPRMLTSLQEIKAQFESSAGFELQLPSWWAETVPVINQKSIADSSPYLKGADEK